MIRLCIALLLAVFCVLLPVRGDSDPPEVDDAAILKKPLSPEVFPCSNCHSGMETNANKRELSFHAEVRIRRHGEPGRWCLDCHDAKDRDRLRLVNGETVDFSRSFRLCGQCHGNIFRDWKAGIHGKRTGSWDGEKKYFPCTSCHNPHSPRFQALAPKPAPLKPEKTLRR